jgi:hypothetical protein
MPNQRSANQKPVLVMMREDFLDEINRAYPEAGYSDRSQFIRDAVYKQIEKLGIQLPLVIKTSPDRTGKGGPKKKKSGISVS